MRSYALLFMAGVLLASPVVSSVQAAPVNRTVAVVNGEMVTSYDLSMLVGQELLRMKLDPKKPADQPAIKALEQQVLDQIVNEIVVAHEAERLNVVVDDAEVDNEVKRVQMGSQMDDAAFEKELKQRGTDLPGFRKRIRNSILRNRLLAGMVGRKIIVSKEEIAAYYEQHGGMINTGQSSGGQAQVAVLVYRNEADAKSWGSRVKSGKVAFGKAVREVSVGPMRESGGLLGFMSLEDMAPALRAQVQKLKAGQVSDPFRMDGVLAQVRLLETRQAAAGSGGSHMSLEEATPIIERILREPRLQERYNEYTEQLRKKAVVDIRL